MSNVASACDACGPEGCTPPPTPVPTPSPVPPPTAGCGNGIVDPGEECDGPTCLSRFDGSQSTCGAPAGANQCECRDIPCGTCPGESDLCWPGELCLAMPGGGDCILASCVPYECESHADCSSTSETCQDGRCCLDGTAATLCRIEGYFEMPCCSPLVCPDEPYAECCLPAGEECRFDGSCCSRSCLSGVCQ